MGGLWFTLLPPIYTHTVYPCPFPHILSFTLVDTLLSLNLSAHTHQLFTPLSLSTSIKSSHLSSLKNRLIHYAETSLSGESRERERTHNSNMSPSLDCVSSSLLCGEDNNSLMCFDDSDYEFQENPSSYSPNGDSFSMWFSMYSDESIGLMVHTETQHLPRYDYLGRLQGGDVDLEMRNQAVDWISKVHAHYNFGPLSTYLSINYLDRFLSAYELPKGKAWLMQLLAVACVSIAAKMEETDVPLSLDLQVGESKFIFEAKTIQRMELLVLSTLNWRMQAITPFSFIDYFLWKSNEDQSPHRLSVSRCVGIILTMLKGIDYLKFRPSEIAAAVAISVLRENQPVDIDKAARCFIQHVEKERVSKCIEMIQDVPVTSTYVKDANRAQVTSVPQSPVGVLDAAACLSYKTDEITVGSCASYYHSSSDAKRRKLNQASELERAHLSQLVGAHLHQT